MISPFDLRTVGRLRFGRGTAGEAPAAVRRLGSRPFLVHGRNPERAAWLARELRPTNSASATGEPTLEHVELVVAEVRASGADVVVAIGGGSAIDLGKVAAALAPARAEPLRYLEVVGEGQPLDADPLPFVALPTTAGTGAEVTRNGVIGLPEHRRKVSLRDDRMLADIAIVDPGLTEGAPHGVTLASGLDAIVQVIEPYLSRRANPFSDALCQAAIPLALDALPRVVEGADADACDAMAWVSVCGGLALTSAGLGAVHGLAGVLGGWTGAPHGALCGRLLPPVLRANAAAAPGPRIDWVQERIAARFGTLDGLERWMGDAGLPRLAELGLAAADVDDVAEAARLSSSMKANPVELPADELAGILRAAR